MVMQLLSLKMTKANHSPSAAGGETSLDNLMLLCSRHHRLVHEGGFRIERDYQDHWFFKRPDGRAMPACGYQAQDVIDDDIGEFSMLLNHPSAEGSAGFL
jgi:hypothetical protein